MGSWSDRYFQDGRRSDEHDDVTQRLYEAVMGALVAATARR